MCRTFVLVGLCIIKMIQCTAEGLCTSRTVNGEKTVFVWDGDQLVMELSESGKVQKRYDKETDIIYLRARYYQPYLGRFLTRDIYTGEEDDPLSLHLYTYCGNDGVNRIDPSGHFWKKIVKGIKDGLIDIYKGIAESVKHPIRPLRLRVAPRRTGKPMLNC